MYVYVKGVCLPLSGNSGRSYIVVGSSWFSFSLILLLLVLSAYGVYIISYANLLLCVRAFLCLFILKRGFSHRI